MIAVVDLDGRKPDFYQSDCCRRAVSGQDSPKTSYRQSKPKLQGGPSVSTRRQNRGGVTGVSVPATLAAAAIVVVGLSGPAEADNPTLQPAAAPDRARSERDCREAVRALLTDRTGDEIRSLRHHSDNTVALCSAWMQVEQVIRTEDGIENSTGAALALKQFVGFVEGRLEVTAPDWWSKSLDICYVHQQGHLVFNGPPLGDRFDPRNMCRSMPVAGDVDSDGDENEESHGEYGWVIWFVGQQGLNLQQSKPSAVATNDHHRVLGFAGMFPYSYPLICVTNDKVTWSTDVWAFDGITFYTGAPGYHWNEIVIDNDRVFVFGRRRFPITSRSSTRATVKQCADSVQGSALLPRLRTVSDRSTVVGAGTTASIAICKSRD